MKYVLYYLLWVDNTGCQPYHQVAQAGAQFEGGYYCQDGRYLGYIWGTDEQCVLAIQLSQAWQVMVLTESEALAWAEEVAPINNEVNDEGATRYVGPAEIDENGRVAQPLSDEEWEV